MKTHQEEVDEWIGRYGIRYFNELTNLGQLVEEVGELSRLIIREYGEQSWKIEEKPENIKDKIADELADVLFVLYCLANQMNIDMEKAFRNNLNKKTVRDMNRHLNNLKL